MRTTLLPDTLAVAFTLSLTLTSLSCHATSYEEAEQLFNIQVQETYNRDEKYKEAQTKAINDAWQLTGPCFNMGIDDETTLIVKVSSSGNVESIWANRKHAKADCLKAIFSVRKFPVPLVQPYFFKVII